MAKFTTAANKTSRRNEMIQKLKNGQKFNIFLSQDFDLVNLLKCFENVLHWIKIKRRTVLCKFKQTCSLTYF